MLIRQETLLDLCSFELLNVKVCFKLGNSIKHYFQVITIQLTAQLINYRKHILSWRILCNMLMDGKLRCYFKYETKGSWFIVYSNLASEGHMDSH